MNVSISDSLCVSNFEPPVTVSTSFGTSPYLARSCGVTFTPCVSTAAATFDGPAVPVNNYAVSHAPVSRVSTLPVITASNFYHNRIQSGLTPPATSSPVGEFGLHGLAGTAIDLPGSVSHITAPNLVYSHQPPIQMASAPHSTSKSDATKSTVEEFARVLVRCQGSRALVEEERYSGQPLLYHQFIRQVEDRILNVHAQTDPGHALQLLLESTTGRARKLISSCIMLPPAEALAKALQLLYKSFGSPAVAVKAHLKLVCEGPTIHSDERSLQDFYSDLVNCKMVVESAKATHLLDSVATAEGIFSRFPQHFQRQFAELALRRGYDMEVVPFDLFIEFIDQSQRLASSRLGRLMKTSKDKMPLRGTGWSKPKPARAHVVQMDVEAKSSDHGSEKQTKRDLQASVQCPACEATDHRIWRCQRFSQDSLNDRKTLVKKKRLCFNCLGIGHGVKNCTSKARCRVCARMHHSLLHPLSTDQLPTSSGLQKQEETGEDKPQSSTYSSNLASTSTDTSQVVNVSRIKGARNRLQVLPVLVVNPSTGAGKECWALLDTGADTHLLSRSLYSELGLEGQPVLSSLQLANGDLKTFHTYETCCVLQDVNRNCSFHLDGVRVVEKLPDLSGSIPSTTDALRYEHLAGIEISDISGDKVELLIGTGTPELHVFLEVRRGDEAKPWAGKTPLGWVLFGHETYQPKLEKEIDRVNLIATHRVDGVSEAICPCQFEHADLFNESDIKLPSIDDEKASEIMATSCELVDGHYLMRLPWREGCPKLPNNYSMAQSRLKGLGCRLKKEPEILAAYQAKINEMIQLGHATDVSQDSSSIPDEQVWYIPHHYTGKKFRVVFDCAAGCDGTSINQQLLQGPDNTSTLIGVLLRFRLYPVALVGDIKNMFHQVRVHTKDQPALRFLWWEDGDPGKPIKTYQLTVHTFGLTSSPSVAGYALRQTADQNLTNASELTLSAIRNNFYVDDLLMSVRCSAQAVQLIAELDEVLGSGGFTLAKYVSNRPEVLEALPVSRLSPQLQDINIHDDDLPTHKTLGLIWNASSDCFCIKISIAEHNLTRRGLLSVLSSVYDPLGIAGPYMLPAKLILQRLAKQDLGWDTEIPEDARSAWKLWLKALPQLNGLSIPRVYIGFENKAYLQLHIFADASKDGYGAVCYLCCGNKTERSCVFVIGKSRVAPMNQQSIPRLELCAAVLAVRLFLIVMREHRFQVDDVYFWTDSTTVLSYVCNTSKRRPAFETNRIATIRKHTNVNQWRWVDTHQNPADPYSRGVSPKQIHKAEKWLKAPEFVLQDESLWPAVNRTVASCSGPFSIKKSTDAFESNCQVSGMQHSCGLTAATLSVPAVLIRLTTRFSSLIRAVKSTVWLLRAKQLLRNRVKVKNASSPVDDEIGPLEYDTALLTLIRLVQQQEFPGLVEALEQCPWYEVAKGKCGRTAKQAMQPLLKYCPLVMDGVIRLGGRLQRSSMSKDFKDPIVLPKRHHFTGLIVCNYHAELGHNSSNYVLNSLRSRYHLVGQERTVKYYIRERCMLCRNQKATFGSQLMAPLPPARVEIGNSAFENCGVDYMGPLEVKQG